MKKHSKPKRKTLTLYMCGVDWQHEADAVTSGTSVYPSRKAILRHRTCVKDCGIVAVKVQLSRWVQKQNFRKQRRRSGKEA